MAAHLSHKIRWDLLADYVTAYSDQGISLPVGDCGRIHATKRKHQIQVEMRKYITDNMICTAEGCETTGEKNFRKHNRKGPFERGQRDERKLVQFMESFHNAVHEFASTELNSPAKPVVYENVIRKKDLSPSCCDEFILYIEFGDKKKLFEYSDSELNDILSCGNGGQLVGHNLVLLFHNVVRFYLFSNVIVHLGLRTEGQWPEFMKPESCFRKSLLYACGGQYFLPHSRQYLSKAMIDLDETRILSERLFRAIYFYVMMKMKLDSSYKLQDDFDISFFRDYSR